MFRAFSRSLSCLQSALETECMTKNRTSEYQRKTRLKIPNIPTYFQCGQASRKELSSALKLNILIKTEKQMEKNPWLSPWFLAIKQGCSDDLGGTYCNCLALKCSIYIIIQFTRNLILITTLSSIFVLVKSFIFF